MKRSGRFQFGLLCAGSLAVVGGAGCYEQTVQSRGMGSSRGSVSPVYRSETVVDHAFDSLVGNPPSSGTTGRAVPNSKAPATLSTAEKRNQ